MFLFTKNFFLQIFYDIWIYVWLIINNSILLNLINVILINKFKLIYFKLNEYILKIVNNIKIFLNNYIIININIFNIFIKIKIYILLISYIYYFLLLKK